MRKETNLCPDQMIVIKKSLGTPSHRHTHMYHTINSIYKYLKSWKEIHSVKEKKKKHL